MAGEASRSRRLGDVGAERPRRLGLGRPDATMPHLLVMLFARPGELEAWERKVTGRGWGARLRAAGAAGHARHRRHRAVRLRRRRQPAADRLELRAARRTAATSSTSATRWRWARSLLGYRNEYGLYTDRPLLDPAYDPAAEDLPPALDAPHRRDLGRNGSYLVFRQLEQDVRGFWRFVDEQAGARRGSGAGRWRDAMVGRQRDGSPLVPPTPS